MSHSTRPDSQMPKLEIPGPLATVRRDWIRFFPGSVEDPMMMLMKSMAADNPWPTGLSEALKGQDKAIIGHKSFSSPNWSCIMMSIVKSLDTLLADGFLSEKDHESIYKPLLRASGNLRASPLKIHEQVLRLYTAVFSEKMTPAAVRAAWKKNMFVLADLGIPGHGEEAYFRTAFSKMTVKKQPKRPNGSENPELELVDEALEEWRPNT